MPKDRLSVMVSSTVLDLPDHRPEIRDACLQEGMQPLMMEHLPASDSEAISVSLKMVNEADIYLGIFAHRYGYVPKKNNRKRISITEMEYNRAVERGMPRLIFMMDKAHLITIESVEWGNGKLKLDALKKRMEVERTVKFFTSPIGLRAEASHGLSELRKEYLLASARPSGTYVFVAHGKHEWSKYVIPFVARLRAAGFSVWISQNQNDATELYQELKLSNWLVLCVSPSALKSKFVKMQLNYFIENKKSIILLICREAKLPEELEEAETFTYSQMDRLINYLKSLQEQSPFAKYEL